MPSLVLLNVKTRKRIPIPDDEQVVIGREAEGAEALSNMPQISREHCLIVRTGGRLTVRDLGSRHGTFVGEDRLDCKDSAQPIENNSLLHLGRECFLVMLALPTELAPAPPKPSDESQSESSVPPTLERWHCKICENSAAKGPENGVCPVCGKYSG
jgi:predicted component of type VI protein secretion system